MHRMLRAFLPTPSSLSRLAWGRVKVNSSVLQLLSLDDNVLSGFCCRQDELSTYEYIEHIMSCLRSDGQGT
jgi:hypothetical protein